MIKDTLKYKLLHEDINDLSSGMTKMFTTAPDGETKYLANMKADAPDMSGTRADGTGSIPKTLEDFRKLKQQEAQNNNLNYMTNAPDNAKMIAPGPTNEFNKTFTNQQPQSTFFKKIGQSQELEQQKANQLRARMN